MNTTIFFREDAHLSFPPVCVGCGSNDPTKTLKWTIFSSPSLSSGAKAFKAANVLVGLAMGGIGGAMGGAHLGNTLKKSKATALHTLPICELCLSRFSSTHLQIVSEASEGLFQDTGITTPAFSLKMIKGCASWTLVNERFAKLVTDMNKGEVFLSLDHCIANSQSPGKQPELGFEEASQLPVVDAKSLANYQSIYKRALSPIEAVVVDSWHAIVGKHKTIYTYPDIPEKKLKNAIASYAKCSSNELIIALQDSSLFGSAKQGALFTSLGIHGSPPGVNKPISIHYWQIVPSFVSFDSSFTKSCIILGTDQRIWLNGFQGDTEFAALCAFISKVATFTKHP